MLGEAFKKDLEKYYRIHLRNPSPPFRSRLRLWICSHGLHCVAAYRLGQFARKRYKKHPLSAMLVIFHKAISYSVSAFYHVHINDADIGPGLYIGHVGNIYIGETEIGENFSLTHNVTIGIGHANRRAGVPKRIGNNVWIGTGSTIYGDIEIGNNVTIATGCILSRDVPDGCLVGGNPGRMILRRYDNSGLFGCEEPLPPMPQPPYNLPTEGPTESATVPPPP